MTKLKIRTWGVLFRLALRAEGVIVRTRDLAQKRKMALVSGANPGRAW
jgi:hypothetical protein